MSRLVLAFCAVSALGVLAGLSAPAMAADPNTVTLTLTTHDQLDDVWIYDGRYLGTGYAVQFQRYQYIKRDLFKFDLSSIPSNAIIDSAVYTYHMGSNLAAGEPQLDLHYVTQPWAEAACSWTVRDGSDPNNILYWNTPGGDYDPNVAAVIADMPAQAMWGEYSWTQSAPLVQAWVSGTVPNYGLLIKYDVENEAPSGGFNIWSSEAAEAKNDPAYLAQQPIMTITYHLPSLLGDTDGNGVVDVNDLNNVFNNLGTANPLGDTDNNGVVDVNDLNNVFNNLGTVAGGGDASVPEPATLSLLALGGMALIRRR